MKRVLQINSSANVAESITREMGDEVVRRLRQADEVELVQRNVSHDMTYIDAAWLEANSTDAEVLSAEQKSLLSLSDTLIAELNAADVLVLTIPLYNFSIPAALKGWIDQICRAKLTFRYTENGPEGLLRDRPVYIVMASGGVKFGSEVDYASDYMKQVLAFIGITDVRFIFMDQIMMNDQAKAQALAVLDEYLVDDGLVDDGLADETGEVYA